jgi:hypothetical protein
MPCCDTVRHDTVQYGRLKCGRVGYCTAWYNLLGFCFFVAREALITFHGNFTLGGSNSWSQSAGCPNQLSPRVSGAHSPASFHPFSSQLSPILQPAFTQGFWGPVCSQLSLRISWAHSPASFHSGFPGAHSPASFHSGFLGPILPPAFTQGFWGPFSHQLSLRVSGAHHSTRFQSRVSGLHPLDSHQPRFPGAHPTASFTHGF